MEIHNHNRWFRTNTISDSFLGRVNTCGKSNLSSIASKIVALANKYSGNPKEFLAAYRDDKNFSRDERQLFGYPDNSMFRTMAQTSNDIATRASAILIAHLGDNSEINHNKLNAALENKYNTTTISLEAGTLLCNKLNKEAENNDAPIHVAPKTVSAPNPETIKLYGITFSNVWCEIPENFELHECHVVSNAYIIFYSGTLIAKHGGKACAKGAGSIAYAIGRDSIAYASNGAEAFAKFCAISTATGAGSKAHAKTGAKAFAESGAISIATGAGSKSYASNGADAFAESGAMSIATGIGSRAYASNGSKASAEFGAISIAKDTGSVAYAYEDSVALAHTLDAKAVVLGNRGKAFNRSEVKKYRNTFCSRHMSEDGRNFEYYLQLENGNRKLIQTKPISAKKPTRKELGKGGFGVVVEKSGYSNLQKVDKNNYCASDIKEITTYFESVKSRIEASQNKELLTKISLPTILSHRDQTAKMILSNRFQGHEGGGNITKEVRHKQIQSALAITIQAQQFGSYFKDNVLRNWMVNDSGDIVGRIDLDFDGIANVSPRTLFGNDIGFINRVDDLKHKRKKTDEDKHKNVIDELSQGDEIKQQILHRIQSIVELLAECFSDQELGSWNETTKQKIRDAIPNDIPPFTTQDLSDLFVAWSVKVDQKVIERFMSKYYDARTGFLKTKLSS